MTRKVLGTAIVVNTITRIFIEQLPCASTCVYIVSDNKNPLGGITTIILHMGISLALDTVLHAFAKEKGII